MDIFPPRGYDSCSVSDTSVDLSAVHTNLPALFPALPSQESWIRNSDGGPDAHETEGAQVRADIALAKRSSSSASALWLWLGVDLSPKLNFLSLPSLSFSRLPTARHFLFSHGQLLREHAHICGFLGLAAEYAAPVKFFRSDLAQHPN